jgi:hypothetical protein
MDGMRSRREEIEHASWGIWTLSSCQRIQDPWMGGTKVA